MQPFQRDVATAETRDEVERIERALDRSAPDAYRRGLGRRADLLRILGRTDEAIADLQACLRMAREAKDEAARGWNLIRIGTARQYAGDHEQALRDLRHALAVAQALSDLAMQGYAHQHLGKCLVECRRLTEARAHLVKAQGIRKELADPGLLASTRRALEEVERMLRAPDP